MTAAASNDNFATRSTLRGASGRLTGNFYEATLEAGEPLPHLFGSKSSLWFKFAATTSTTLALEQTDNDAGVSYIETVFLESAASPSLSTLVEVPSSAVTGTGDSYALQGGRTYAIQIRDVVFERGPFTVLWRLVGACAIVCPLGCVGVRGLPLSALVALLRCWCCGCEGAAASPNDMLAQRSTLSRLSGRTAGSVSGAAVQPLEAALLVNTFGISGDTLWQTPTRTRAVWYAWTATAAGCERHGLTTLALAVLAPAGPTMCLLE